MFLIEPGPFCFMADDLSLLFKLRGDNQQLKGVLADSSAATRATVNQLRQSFGPQLNQSISVTNKAFSDLGENLQNFVAQRAPLVGGAFIRVTDGLKSVGNQSPKTEKAVAGVAQSIESIATQSGKSIPQVAAFLTRFVQIEGQTKRNEAAFKFFGGSVDLIGNKTAKFIPELEKAGTALAGVTAEGAAAGSSIAAMAGPIGIAVLALAALAAGAAIATKQLIDLAVSTASFQGKMFDLAQQTGLAVETLSAFEVVAKTTGGELGSITQAIVLFQRKLDEAQDPLSKAAEQFRKFNVTTEDTETSLRSAFAALAAMPEGFAQTNAAAEFFGARGGKQVLAILKETNGDIDGTIKRLREMGALISEDAARAADKFNDELALLQFQFRALGAVAAEDLIPAMVEIIKSSGEIVTALRPLIGLFGTLAGITARSVGSAFKGLSLVVQALTLDYKGLTKAIKEARDEQNIGAIKVPDVSPVPLPGAVTPRQSASEAVNQAEAVVAAVKRSVAAQNQALDALFQQGRRTREEQANEVIASNKRILEAEQQRIEATLSLKEQEIKALDEAASKRGEINNRDTEQYRGITAQIGKLQQERLDKESEFEVSARAIRAKAAKERADATRNQVKNETDLLLGEFDRQIKTIEAQITRGDTAEESGLTIIEQIEQSKIEARLKGLERQREIGFLTIQDQVDLNEEIKKVNQDRDRLSDEQQQRRIDRERSAGQRIIDIALGNIEALIQIEQIAGQRQIDTIQALADRRVITEEDAARKILQIRLKLIDDEIEAVGSRLAATDSIADKDERIRAQADLNNQIKILTEQRKSIQADGNRELEAGRQTDLNNERQYAKDLRDIKEEVREIEREAAEEVLRLMIIHFASRRDIIRARLQIDIEDERSRHRNAQQGISALRQENLESNRTKQEKLEQEETINRLEEAEAERHRLALQGIKDQGKQEESEADPLGRFQLDTESLRQFASVIQDSIVPLGEILRNTFSQVADAIGQTVANWVLLGETGPAVMRKILATALAAVAAEAAVNAIKELALGFATLFFNPAESAAHFTAAGLWASIGAGSAIAGRAVAGDLFKPANSGAGGGESSNRSNTPQRSSQPAPIDIGRNQSAPFVGGEVQITFKGDAGDFIEAKWVDKYRGGGRLRNLVLNDQES